MYCFRAFVLNNDQYSNVPRINGELAVTRSFGDKRHSDSGLIAEPEITKRKITTDDKYILLATDGFWDVTNT